jgi:hypothetical protein
MASKKKSKSALNALASALILLVIALVGGVLAYKQIFLGNLIAGKLPRDALGQSLSQCARMYHAPLAGQTADPFGTQGWMSMILQGVSANTLETQVQHQIDEIKLLKIEDFLGDNARMRVSGAMQISTQVPIMGPLLSRQLYQVEIHKQGNAYSFPKLAVKAENQTDWQEWPCAGRF